MQFGILIILYYYDVKVEKNRAHSALIGVVMYVDWGDRSTRTVSSYTIWMMHDFGVYIVTMAKGSNNITTQYDSCMNLEFYIITKSNNCYNTTQI